MPDLAKQELLGRLAEGHAARVTVVTPNARLVQALMADVDAFQAGMGLSVWEAPDILPFSAFVERLYEDALYSELPAELPMLLTPAQEAWLWAEVVRASGREILSPERTAEQCRAAWQLAHAWRIPPQAGNEDGAAFAAWSRAYEKRTTADVDAARLPDAVLEVIEHLRKPKLLVAYAFDLLTPQMRDFFAACEAQGVDVRECHSEKCRSRIARVSFASSKEELDAAARWARARLENRALTPISPENRGQSPISPRIGVVVPDLSQRRKEVVRVFSRTMNPGFSLPGAPKAPMPFNVSLGVPLAEYPLVHTALALLELCHGEIPYEEASRLVRSPFIGGAERELSERAKLDVRLRRHIEATVSLPKLLGYVDGTPGLRGLLESTFQHLRENNEPLRTPSNWARHFSALLEAAGFPGERTLDSEEFQARAKWHEVLGELAKLDRVSPNASAHQARSILKRLCTETLFQPESGDAPIQVLGILESAGLAFDHLWVSGLTDEAWPLRARPNPFVPVAAQKKAGIPEASAEGSAALDERITAGWKGAAGEVVFSHFEKEEDRELAVSPLVADLATDSLDIPSFPGFRDEIFTGRNLSSVEDRVAPPIAAPAVRGGTRVLADQAACPFRAFARWRLRAEPLETPAEGLDAAQRGTLLHELMKHLWSSLKDSSALEHYLEPFIENAAEAAVKELGLAGRFAELERERLSRLAREWLDIEKGRERFEVVSIEEKRSLRVGPLELSARIDRMDRLEGGGHVLIDYKTSRAPSPKHWEPPRPDDPQLPVYAVSVKEDIAAVAFAKVRPGDMKFMGFSEEEGVVPGVKPAKAWAPLLRSWKDEALRLASGFAAGEAGVDPKRGLQTCRHCDLHTLCRVYEKLNTLEEQQEANGEGTGP